MFGSVFNRQVVAAFAALLVSTVAVGSAVGPALASNPAVTANA